jgi:hypothetical protein
MVHLGHDPRPGSQIEDSTRQALRNSTQRRPAMFTGV